MNKLIVLLVLACSVCFGDIIVDHTGDGDHLTIQAAINAASNGDTVVVMPGTYIENINMKGKAITLRSSDPTDPSVVVTTIIDPNDLGSIIKCVSGEGADTVVSGFLITNGSGFDGSGMYNSFSSPTIRNCTFSGNSASYEGGGMYNHVASPTVINCTFSGNTANRYGGGIYNYYSSPAVTKCTFSGNIGSGMYNDWVSSPTVNNCTFSDNIASHGGGMSNNHSSSPTVSNCMFSSNMANSYGGGMCNRNYSSPSASNCTFSENTANGGGGMFNFDSSPTVNNCMFSGNMAETMGGGMFSSYGFLLTISNCTFSGNTAEAGSGMFNYFSSLSVNNCTFNSNTAFDGGGGMYNYHSSPMVSNCILWGNIASTSGNEIYNDGSLPVISYCDIFGCGSSGAGWDLSFGTDGGGNIDSDPLFVNVDLGNFCLQEGSPCIDQGNNDSVPAEITTDLYGYPRIVDFDCNGSATVDMGAYERPMTQLISGDTNYDCRVDMLDLALLAENWLVGVE